MTDQDLLDRGFKRYPRAWFESDGIDVCFQKRYDDEVGKRYFININKWKPIEDRNAPDGVWPANYEYEVYFQNNDSEKRGAIKILLYAGWDIDEVEEYVQKLFETGLFEYYEKWEDC